jgi:hypothetical protein
MKKLTALLLALVSSCPSRLRREIVVEGAQTVTDMTGREVKLEKPAEKIVALTAANVKSFTRWVPEARLWAAANTAIIRKRCCPCRPYSPAPTKH